jgi:CBS domain-containing protein
MRVSELMTAAPQTIAPDASLRRAAELMDRLDVGALPICEDGRLIGIVTDRDITVRATAIGSPPDSTPVSEVMSDDVRCVTQEDDTADAEEVMAAAQIRRVPVVDADRRVVGILSLGDLAVAREQGTEATLELISQPGHPDR